MIARSVGRSVGRSIGSVGFATGGGGPSYDTDAQAYITLVETADTESLETGVKDAINAFVVGCKSDGIWTAIKASCILAGARTLSGALVPLVGTAPTNNNFVSGDYDRKTGLVGDGSTKYLNSNRNNNADPQNSKHLFSYITSQALLATSPAIGVNTIASGGSWLSQNPDNTTASMRINAGTSYQYLFAFPITAGSFGANRSGASSLQLISDGNLQTSTIASATPSSENILILAAIGAFGTHRISFYSIGESLDLALLDSRVSTLMTAIGAAIP